MFQSEQIVDETESEINRLKKESNQEATERIGNKLRTETKLNERRDVVMNYFFEITQMPMPLAWFEEYNKLFNKAPDGYNIESFIKTKKKEISDYKELMKKAK